MPKRMCCHKAILVITGRAHCFHDCIYITLILLLWSLSALCVVNSLWPLILSPCLACWALFGSLVPAMCNCTSCAQVYELPQSHCGNNREGTLFHFMIAYILHSPCFCETWTLCYIYRYIYIYMVIYILYIYVYICIIYKFIYIYIRVSDHAPLTKS